MSCLTHICGEAPNLNDLQKFPGASNPHMWEAPTQVRDKEAKQVSDPHTWGSTCTSVGDKDAGKVLPTCVGRRLSINVVEGLAPRYYPHMWEAPFLPIHPLVLRVSDPHTWGSTLVHRHANSGTIV